ncbi:uncharacterized protein METZ01_LOCUS229475 [marine metagenome]|uniref:Uncharacterized protein n=1 Tax=marine metagenome TaxID=408172 RepID=A0A382GR29_9ZZZZ
MSVPTFCSFGHNNWIVIINPNQFKLTGIGG